MYQSTLEEWVVKVVKENRADIFSQKDNLHLERTRCNTPKYLRTQEPTFQACLGKPKGYCRRGALTQFHQRVAIGRTRSYKDKQYMQRIEEFKYDAQLEQKHHFITKEFINESQQEETTSWWSQLQCVGGECTYTHLLHAHFSAYSAFTAYFAHFSCVSHTHGSRVPKRFFAHVSFLSISPTPVSCLTHPCCSLTVTSRPFLTLTSTSSCRTHLS